jgi:hypothetical protein
VGGEGGRGDREDFRIVCTRVGMISVSHAAAPFQLRLPLALASRSFLPTSEVSSLSLSHRLFRVGEGYRRSPEQRRARKDFCIPKQKISVFLNPKPYTLHPKAFFAHIKER